MNTQTKAFGAFCRAARAVLGWSQAELAKRSGMAVPSIARIETGVVNPRHDSITTIIQVIQKAGLGVTYEWDGSFTIQANKTLFESMPEN